MTKGQRELGMNWLEHEAGDDWRKEGGMRVGVGEGWEWTQQG